jgi:hypothetical protein
MNKDLSDGGDIDLPRSAETIAADQRVLGCMVAMASAIQAAETATPAASRLAAIGPARATIDDFEAASSAKIDALDRDVAAHERATGRDLSVYRDGLKKGLAVTLKCLIVERSKLDAVEIAMRGMM